jgi:formylglycine-generating enzyme required for sulfatase activity
MTLPTEAQWMLAARGAIHLPNGPNPSPKRPYPWGDQKHTCQRANLHWCFPTQRNGVQIPSLLPIHRPLGDISPLGVRMLAGNVAEMMRDGMIKGGSAFSEALPLDQRGRIELRQGLSWVGFRCIKEN